MTAGQGAPQQQWLTIHDPATCTRKGLSPVAKSTGQGPHLEAHSLINDGLNSWVGQVKHFGRLPQYSILVFDNRGTGNSDTPKGLYSTSAMAEDAIVLLDFIGWTESRSVHVVGLSLGGMIAQELAYRIPERCISLSLAATTAGGLPIFNIPPVCRIEAYFKGDWTKIVTIHQGPRKAYSHQCGDEFQLFMVGMREPRTILKAGQTVRFKSCHDTLPKAPRACLTDVGGVDAPPRSRASRTDIQIHPQGIDPDRRSGSSSEVIKFGILSKHMPEAEYVVWKETGHAVHLQHAERFNSLLERVFHEGRAKL
ncbi:alpha/beta-hydrolase [Lactarius pseudohatsudake]|nr:alpha/beta-hydrolase [Lactarius pseudohatsudake]